MTASPHLIGFGAGVVAAVLFASLANSSSLALVLFYLTPLPVMLAGIGWGTGASVVSLVTAGVLVSLLLNIQAAGIFLIYVGAPGVILSYLMLMHREYALGPGTGGQSQPQTVIEWYPFGRIIAWAAVMAAAQVSLGIVLIGGGSSEAYVNAIRQLFDESSLSQFQQVLGPEFGAEDLQTMADRFALYILPSFAAALWLTVMAGNLWLAAKSASISGLLRRPVPRFGGIEYPPFLVAGFAAALVASLSPGMFGLIATAFIGALGLAFILLGLAVIHALLAQSPFRLPALIALYAGLFLTPWVAPPVLGVGLAEPFLRLRQRRGSQTPPPPDRSSGDT